MQSLCQGKGQRSHKAKNRRKHFRGEIGRTISNLVAVLVSDLWAMAGKWHSFFQQLAAILNVPFRPNFVELELALIERKQYCCFGTISYYERGCVSLQGQRSFGANGHLHKKVCKTGKVIERSRRHTKAKARKVDPPVHQIW